MSWTRMAGSEMKRVFKTVHYRCGLVLLVIALSVSAAFSQQPAASQASPTPEIKIEFNRRVPMRDRTELSADIYRPKADGRFPVLLNRTPYTKAGGSTLQIAQYFVSHGYVYVAMDVRGRGDSDGKFEP